MSKNTKATGKRDRSGSLSATPEAPLTAKPSKEGAASKADSESAGGPPVVVADDAGPHNAHVASKRTHTDEADKEEDHAGRTLACNMIAGGSAAFATSDVAGANGYSGRDRVAKEQEEKSEIKFIVVVNDGKRASLVYLAGLRALFSRQLPKMPKEYIVRLVFDRQHKSLALLKNNHVIGGITFRPVYLQHFYEIAFCAISNNEQVQGYGTRLMNHLKQFATSEKVWHFLTYADNNAVGYFKKQGFHFAATHMDPHSWRPYIKDYEGATVMECVVNPNVDYLNLSSMIQTQRALVSEKIKEKSNSHIVHDGLPASWFLDKNHDTSTIPGLAAAGWKPSMLSKHNTRGGNDAATAGNDLRSQLRAVYSAVHCHSAAWPFHEPVDRDIAPDYYEHVKDPIDMQEIKRRLDEDYYKTKEMFLADMKRMFTNCRNYNNKETIYHRYADTLEAFTLAKVRLLVL